jgi:hypothetical protein
MKTKIKHNLVIFENAHDWDRIKEKIKQDFGVATAMISWRLKRELGFTVRDHRVPMSWDTTDSFFSSGREVHLDFFNEAAHSWFVLKYLNLE